MSKVGSSLYQTHGFDLSRSVCILDINQEHTQRTIFQYFVKEGVIFEPDTELSYFKIYNGPRA